MQKGLLAKLLLLVALGAGAGAVAEIMLDPGAAPAVVFRPSGWSLLTDDEQTILKPLAGQWDAMGSAQQEKWRGIARKYPSLPVHEQQKIQRRMTRWAGAGPEQRAVARQQYRTYKQRNPETQARVRAAWSSRQVAKTQAAPVPLPGANESPIYAGDVVKESTAGSSAALSDTSPATESPKLESEK